MSRIDREKTEKVSRNILLLSQEVETASINATAAEKVLHWLEICDETPVEAKVSVQMVTGSCAYGVCEVPAYITRIIQRMMPDIIDKVRAEAQAEIDFASEILKKNGVK